MGRRCGKLEVLRAFLAFFPRAGEGGGSLPVLVRRTYVEIHRRDVSIVSAFRLNFGRSDRSCSRARLPSPGVLYALVSSSVRHVADSHRRRRSNIVYSYRFYVLFSC